MRDKWSSRSTFILASVGSAVGLGNAWRFPGLVSKHGGGAFLVIYLVMLLIIGIPLLMMEISLGRRSKKGAPGAFRSLGKKFEPVGWAATANAFGIACYYAVVFAWVIMMVFASIKFIHMTGDSTAASNVFFDMTKSTMDVTGYSIPPILIVALVIAWGSIYFCIRNGASSVGKVVKYTVFLPVIFLLILAIKGVTMPGAAQGLRQLFIPDIAAFADASLWVDAIGQVFYSLSIMMAIMIAYGSFLDEGNNIVEDCFIIAFSDAAISVLSSIVMFSTMGGVGMLDSITDSGIATAFVVYPQAIVRLTGNGYVNAAFGAVFYLMLVTLAIDSAFSIIEGVSTAFADKFSLDHKKTTKWLCVIAGVISMLFITRAGLAWLDIVDNWTNQINLIIIGITECVIVGWFFKTDRVYKEVTKNVNKFNISKIWFNVSIKYIAPLLLTVLFVWNMYELFVIKGGRYGYAAWAEILGGWCVSVLVLVRGFIIKLFQNKVKIDESEFEKVWDEEEK